MEMVTRIALITGANRGLGLEWARQLLSKTEYQVVATCRNPAQAAELRSLQPQSDSMAGNLTILPLDVSREDSVSTLVQSLVDGAAGADPRVDLLIHNAGVISPTHPAEHVLEAKQSVMLRCYEVNVIGPILLTQKIFPLLSQSPPAKVVFTSSKLGSINLCSPPANATNWSASLSYRLSKAALNMGMRCLHEEIKTTSQHLPIFVAMHPGWVDTDMGSAGGRSPPLQPQESVSSMLAVVSQLSPDHGGKFLNYDGSILPW